MSDGYILNVITAAKKPSPGSRPGSRRCVAARGWKPCNDVFIFFPFERTGGVDQPPAGLQVWERAARGFCAADRRNAAGRRAQPPLDLGIARQRAGSGAGRVHQDPVELHRRRAEAVAASRTTRWASAGTSARRFRYRSQAITRAPSAKAWAVLFPGAAHRSSTVIPGSISSSGTIDCAPGSCWRPVSGLIVGFGLFKAARAIVRRLPCRIAAASVRASRGTLSSVRIRPRDRRAIHFAQHRVDEPARRALVGLA